MPIDQSVSETLRERIGFDAQVVSWDGTTAGTHIQKIHVPDARTPPAGYKFVGTPVIAQHRSSVSEERNQVWWEDEVIFFLGLIKF